MKHKNNTRDDLDGYGRNAETREKHNQRKSQGEPIPAPSGKEIKTYHDLDDAPHPLTRGADSEQHGNPRNTSPRHWVAVVAKKQQQNVPDSIERQVSKRNWSNFRGGNHGNKR